MVDAGFGLLGTFAGSRGVPAGNEQLRPCRRESSQGVNGLHETSTYDHPDTLSGT